VLGHRLADQFDDHARQDHAYRLGLWTFLATEVLLFGGLFAVYAAYRVLYPDGFARAEHDNTIAIGTINTVVLITSSFTVAMALHALRLGRPRASVGLLVVTIALGVLFLALKAVEYGVHASAGVLPGALYRAPRLPGAGPTLFYTLYYFMTGLHGLHVVAGVGVLAWVAARTHRRTYTREDHLPFELATLYWHLVDVIWIFLWPLCYRLRG